MSITQVYTRFFSLQLVHDYFENGRCTALAMRPTRTCQERLARAGCLFRSSPDGGYVAWSGHDGGSAAFDLNPVEPFTFLGPVDVHFNRMTVAVSAMKAV